MASAAMPFVIESLDLSYQNQRQQALVITPKNPVVVGRERIERLRGPTSLSKVDRWLIEQATRSTGNRILLFRAKNSAGERVWEFDPSLSDAELEEAGYLLTLALVPFHRRLLARGIVLMVHTDWGLRECYAMRHGVRKLEGELERKTGARDTSSVQVDQWLLSNMLLHVALSLDHVTSRLLPLHLGMIDRRWKQIEPMLAGVPPHAID